MMVATTTIAPPRQDDGSGAGRRRY